ncbi:hypothetical protein OSH11_21540 [Kaistia dalseonensis]|uniref:Uncharacterized protein n=1 Tax=Kaistia dalseonensis TaxID=410840 RepID=A0ABU0HDA8_9HYPH|nr:hypothetical protein [Kaistia dalseonensis]MCX5497295.1 hypothetical protein [Kaistia dalseonensis]MDQ0439932.1 hypothetical protein [Kaistia dalseonensis]
MTPAHQEMVLRMFRRGLTIPAIHHAMGRALSIDMIRLLIADTSEAERRAAAVIRRQRLRSTAKQERRAREAVIRQRHRLIRDLGYRVITVRWPAINKRKEINHDI